MANYTGNTQNGKLPPLNRNHARDEQIRAKRRANPQVWSLRKLGRYYNLTHVRISQIIDTDPQKEGTDDGR